MQFGRCIFPHINQIDQVYARTHRKLPLEHLRKVRGRGRGRGRRRGLGCSTAAAAITMQDVAELGA